MFLHQIHRITNWRLDVREIQLGQIISALEFFSTPDFSRGIFPNFPTFSYDKIISS